MTGSNNTSAENGSGRDTAACTLEGINLKSRKSYSLSQAATTKRVTDGDNGPVSEATLATRFRNMLRYERQMRWEFVPWVPDGIREVVGQKVDDIATVIQPGVYIRNDRGQPIPIGLEKVLTECAQVFPVYQR